MLRHKKLYKNIFKIRQNKLKKILQNLSNYVQAEMLT